MASEAAENLKGHLLATYMYLAKDEPLRDQLLSVIDGIADGSISAGNLLAFARVFRDALPHLKIQYEAVRPVLNMTHSEVLELLPELEAEAAD